MDPTLGELQRQIASLHESFSSYAGRSDERDRMMSDALSSLKTSMAVSDSNTRNHEKALELLGQSYSEIKKDVEYLKLKYWLAVGGGVVIVALGATFANLYVKSKIADSLSAYDIKINQ